MIEFDPKCIEAVLTQRQGAFHSQDLADEAIRLLVHNCRVALGSEAFQQVARLSMLTLLQSVKSVPESLHVNGLAASCGIDNPGGGEIIGERGFMEESLFEKFSLDTTLKEKAG